MSLTVRAMEMIDRKRRAILALALFRGSIGALFTAMPWIVGNGLDGYGATQIGCGVAVVACATQMHRAPWLRWVQASLALMVFFLPFAFSEDVITDSQIYAAVLTGKLLLLTSIVTPELFSAQQTSVPSSASDSSRSDGSKTSNVSTPPN
jgi:hypothetical protein